jgi:proteasome accessory factor B
MARITHLLYRNPHGLSVSELARHFEVTRRTIQRDLNDLHDAGVPLTDDEGDPPRYMVIEGYYIPPIHLSLDDALSLFLAARLLARYADDYDPHIPEALSKLAGVLPDPIQAHIHATIRDLATRDLERDSTFADVLHTLALGWANGRVVRIRHQAAGSDNVHAYDFCPYFIEPSGVGNATYAIGHASYFDDVATFKVERICAAELTDETFDIPESFDGPALLRCAWGIMYGDDLQEVVLRFSPNVTRRVHESCWHPSQTIEDTDDGGCILRLQIARPKEMTYWIRGWGPEVTVLAPEWLRRQLAEEAARTVLLYREG